MAGWYHGEFTRKGPCTAFHGFKAPRDPTHAKGQDGGSNVITVQKNMWQWAMLACCKWPQLKGRPDALQHRVQQAGAQR